MILNSVTEMIGNTPVLRLPIYKSTDFLLKIEKTNPGGSMKDRMARNMVLAAIKDGRLKTGGTIVESSSGNTGVGLAIIAAELGFNFIAVVDHHAASNKIATMKALGAQIRYVQGNFHENEVAVVERQRLAAEIASRLPGSVFMNQSDNPANPEGYAKLAQELLQQTDSAISVLVGCTGTGGSLTGIARELKKNKLVEVIGVEPEGSIIFGPPGHPYYQSGTGTPLGDEVGKVLDYQLIDKGKKVSDSEAFETARFLAAEFGLLVGGSSGGAIYKALEYTFSANIDGAVVCLVADGGEKYLETIFNDEWMKSRGLLNSSIYERLYSWLNCNKPYKSVYAQKDRLIASRI